MGVNKFKRPLLVEGTEVPPEGGFGGGAVDSVNGQTGDVVLAAGDVGALPDTYTPPAAPVQSVNGQTGAVTLNAGDVGALPDTYTPPAAPVQSVNGSTGAVTLTAADVGAATAAQGALATSAVQPADLAEVATSGAYGDLSGTPTIPVVSFATISAIEGDWRGAGVETLGAALLALQGV